MRPSELPLSPLPHGHPVSQILNQTFGMNVVERNQSRGCNVKKLVGGIATRCRAWATRMRWRSLSKGGKWICKVLGRSILDFMQTQASQLLRARAHRTFFAVYRPSPACWPVASIDSNTTEKLVDLGCFNPYVDLHRREEHLGR